MAQKFYIFMMNYEKPQQTKTADGGNEEELYDLFRCAFIFIKKNFIVIIAKCLQNLEIIESSNFCAMAMLAELQMFKISSMKHDLELWVVRRWVWMLESITMMIFQMILLIWHCNFATWNSMFNCSIYHNLAVAYFTTNWTNYQAPVPFSLSCCCWFKLRHLDEDKFISYIFTLYTNCSQQLVSFVNNLVYRV